MAKRSKETPRDVLRGSVKEAIGKLTGDVRVEAEGRAEKETQRSAAKPGTTES